MAWLHTPEHLHRQLSRHERYLRSPRAVLHAGTHHTYPLPERAQTASECRGSWALRLAIAYSTAAWDGHAGESYFEQCQVYTSPYAFEASRVRQEYGEQV